MKATRPRVVRIRFEAELPEPTRDLLDLTDKLGPINTALRDAAERVRVMNGSARIECRMISRRASVPPLPPGEGRGEGQP